MKLSMIKSLQNLKAMLGLIAFASFIVMLFVAEQNFSYKKIENLQQQRKIIQSLTDIPRDDIELAKIQFNGKSNMLLVKIEQLKQLYKYDFVGKYIIYSQKEYMQDLEELKKLTIEFNEAAKAYYVKSRKNDKKNKKLLQEKFQKINKKIDELYIKNVYYNKKKSFIIAQLATLLFILSFLVALWYGRRIRSIVEDIQHLSSVKASREEYQTKTLEADAILLRMRKKSSQSVDKTLIDPVTEVLNNKGLRVSYAQKKNQKESNFTAVVVLEIDNFSKASREYPQELTQTILKKVAFTLSLFEQPHDIIARTDYNQFTLILFRPSKEQCFKDVELMKQSISELKFKLPNGKYTYLSVSGGFFIKPSNKLLDDAIRQAKQLLLFAKEQGGNMIAQMSDLNKLEI